MEGKGMVVPVVVLLGWYTAVCVCVWVWDVMVWCDVMCHIYMYTYVADGSVHIDLDMYVWHM